MVQRVRRGRRDSAVSGGQRRRFPSHCRARRERPIGNPAGCPFSIYLYHHPLRQFFKAVLPVDEHVPADIPLLALTLAFCALLAQYTEARKNKARALVTVLARNLGHAGRRLSHGP